MNNGSVSKVPLTPLTLNGHRLELRLQPPELGEHTGVLLEELGYSRAEIESLLTRKVAGNFPDTRP